MDYREYDPEFINSMLKTIQYQKPQWDKIKHENHVILEDKYRGNKRVARKIQVMYNEKGWDCNRHSGGLQQRRKDSEGKRMERIFQTVQALVNLYGAVKAEKIKEIYNSQNTEKAKYVYLRNPYPEREKADLVFVFDMEEVVIFDRQLGDHEMGTWENWIVHTTILEEEDVERFCGAKTGKPYYAPKREELLRYADFLYFEKSNAYRRLLRFAQQRLMKGKSKLASEMVEELYGYCLDQLSLQGAMDIINCYDVVFDSEQQIQKTMELIVEMANWIRTWKNNGYSIGELARVREEQASGKVKKIGRNDPCPCGSGKKYKKCCLGKEEE